MNMTSVSMPSWANQPITLETLRAVQRQFDAIPKPPKPPVIRIDKYICQMEFAGWKKTHRKSRINKKWQKKYGAVLACKGYAYRVGDVTVCCSCVAKRILHFTEPS